MWANDTKSVPVLNTIDGMRLVSLNNLNGLYELLEGGVGHKHVKFYFAGNAPGMGYYFRVEYYKNQGNRMIASSIVSLILITQLFFRVKVFYF